MITTTDCWGPYREAVEERLAACEDLLDWLRRSLAGETALDRLSFADKAHSLRDAAQSLVDRVDDVEWWLGGCGKPTGGGLRCGRVAGHLDAHRPAHQCWEQQLLTAARLWASACRRVTDRLAWSLLAVRAGAGP